MEATLAWNKLKKELGGGGQRWRQCSPTALMGHLAIQGADWRGSCERVGPGEHTSCVIGEVPGQCRRTTGCGGDRV